MKQQLLYKSAQQLAFENHRNNYQFLKTNKFSSFQSRLNKYSGIGKYHPTVFNHPLNLFDPAFVGVAGSGEFTPSDLSNLVGWWNPDDSATITESLGRVSQMDDKSISGADLTQATGGEQPLLLSASQNGLDTIDYTDTRFLNDSTLSVTANPFSLFVAWKFPTSAQRNGFTNEITQPFWFELAGNVHRFDSSSGNIQFTETLVGLWRYISCLSNGSSSSIRSNAVEKATGTHTDTAWGGFRLGGHDGWWEEEIAETLLYSDNKSGDDLTDLETYMARWA
ncbi:hypothetical protein LCGC14_0380320 [marine sediment metagenome]|uniref:Uncharacterized protein n=1 Tax=marine sediment metagenome TaxID=412755 RepID=A0A0F9VPM7_9ZZZZ